MGCDYVFGKANHHTAKKEHKCDLCGETINIGEKYYRYVSLYDGRFYDNKYHEECITAINKYCKELDYDEYTEDSVNDWIYGKVCDNHECDYCPYNMRTRCGQVKLELGLIHDSEVTEKAVE